MIKPTKANRAAAPDLVGTPAYYNDAGHHAAIIEQLKSCGLMPAAWALEDLLAKVERLDALEEEVDNLIDVSKALENLQQDYDLLEKENHEQAMVINRLEDELAEMQFGEST